MSIAGQAPEHVHDKGILVEEQVLRRYDRVGETGPKGTSVGTS